ncbi:MAG TPA: hypothetical protein VL200_12710 [Lacunisphaera sp.]|nr:hypothetical protein [Lacunisphaera sp.]
MLCPARESVGPARPGGTSDASPLGSGREPSGRCTALILVELLARNEEMVEQLREEGRGVDGANGLIARLIGHHEQAAKLLRTQLRAADNGLA